jgi:hypothetical protein
MRRREFIAGLGGAAAWPLAARAQPAAMPVIGHLDLGPPEMRKSLVAVFRKGLSETGYVEGRNLAIAWCDRSARPARQLTCADGSAMGGCCRASRSRSRGPVTESSARASGFGPSGSRWS